MKFTYEHKSKTLFWDDVWKDENIKGNEKLILIYLIGHFNPKEGYAYPSIAAMVKECGLNKRTVLKVLSSLEEKGYIKKVLSPKIKTDKGVQFQNNKYFIKCNEYMCYENNNKSPRVELTKVEEPVEEIVEEDPVAVEEPVEVQLQDEINEVEEPNSLVMSWKPYYTEAVTNGFDSLMMFKKNCVIEYCRVTGTTIPQ